MLVQRINALMDSSPLAIEVVLIDDGSKDDTALKIRQLALTDDRYQCFFIKKSWAPIGFNCGDCFRTRDRRFVCDRWRFAGSARIAS